MKTLFLGMCALVILVGCSKAKESLGLDAPPPDEFLVMRHAPLEMPPDYYLRPPTPGAPRPQERNTIDTARTAAFGAPVSRNKPTSGETALLRAAGAQGADPGVRAQLSTESKDKGTRATVDKLLGTNFGGPPGAEEILDPIEESRKARSAQTERVNP